MSGKNGTIVTNTNQFKQETQEYFKCTSNQFTVSRKM